MKTTHFFSIAAFMLFAGLPVSFAQPSHAPTTTVTGDDMSGGGIDDATPEWMKKLSIDPSGPKAKAHAEAAKTRKDSEKELRKLRLKYFGHNKGAAVKQEGLSKLRAFDNPALYPLLIEIFKHEDTDVRLAVLDIFRDAQSDAGDASLAWVAVQDDDAGMRSAAGERLHSRLHKDKAPSEQVKLVVFEGLRSNKNSAMSAAGQLASGLNLVEVIPWLINAQITGQALGQSASAGSLDTPERSLAWILVGQQTAFVSDLVPVVGTSAVAFDPKLSVITTGVVLRIVDAAVLTYHVDLHDILTDWTSRETGEDTRELGYNIPKWNKWYKEDFQPKMAAKAEEEKAKLAEKKAAMATPTPAPKGGG